MEPKTLETSKRPPFASGYTVREAARLLGLTSSQVQSFVRDGFLQPRRGARGEFRFSFQDLVLLRTAKELSAQLSPRKVKRALRTLCRQLPRGRALTEVRIAVRGDDIVVCDAGQTWNPESGQTQLDFGVSDLAAEAAPWIRKAVRQAKDTEETLAAEDWYELGCELEACDSEESLAAYRRCLDLDADHVDAHVNLGRLLHEQGEHDEAARHYQRALDIEPQEATAAYNLGVLLQDTGCLAEAATAYQQAIAADAECADAHYNLAHVYEEMGKPQAAVKHLTIYRQLAKFS